MINVLIVNEEINKVFIFIFGSKPTYKADSYFGIFKIRKPATGAGFICAEEEIRTPKPFRALPPQSSASTNFATSANS